MSEYRFDRYRNGCRMAEGLVLTKFTSVDDAVAVVAAMAQSGEIYVMRQDARIAELEAERDAAKAGEARAVEALRKLSISARLAANYADDVKDRDDAWTEIAVLIGEVRGIREVLDCSQPALDWLAQREREAAARELEQLMKSEWKWEEFELKASINARIAALTNQQPTACSREEK